jgi:L-2,4-diaminobutyrate decarboxylase
MGLLLARESAGRQHGVQIQKQGLEGQCRKFRILCSEAAHFSVRQSAALLGLGEQAVVTVATDGNFCMLPIALKETVEQLESEGLLPIAVVATAGTTDFGAIDPIDKIAAICQKKQLWLHVDAAYGGALLLSEQHADRLNGIALANSVTVDFHKLFYQPISCGAFLVRDREYFDLIHLRSDYLNPEENEFNGILDLVSKSIQTTRRFDGLKLFMSMQVLGQSTFAQMIDGILALTKSVAQVMSADTALEVANPNPSLTTVVFRYLPQGAAAEFIDSINQNIRTEIMAEGLAVIAQTRLAGQIYLKFTLLNPLTNFKHVQTIVTTVKRIGANLSNRYA